MTPDPGIQLRDIHGLDAIPAWPPGPGWWLTLLLVIVLVYVLAAVIRHFYRHPPGTWHRDAWKQLRDLRHRADEMQPDQIADELSELLRRIAVARYGRRQAAALTGERWLAWLHQHDPDGFQWKLLGKPLVTLPYAPAGSRKFNRQQLMPLIDAAFAWTRRQWRLRRA